MGPAFQAEIEALQQLLMAKEKEIGRLQKHIDKQDSKMTQITNENTQLKEQLTQSSSGSQLQQTVTTLNEKLRKQTALNRLQAGQILEFEQALWQANRQREEAEQKLFDQSAASAPGGQDESMLQDANNEHRIKSVQIREMQHQLDAYQGKATAINTFTKTELVDLEEELS